MTRRWNAFLEKTPLVLTPYFLQPTPDWDCDQRSLAGTRALFDSAIYSTGINWLSLPAGVTPIGEMFAVATGPATEARGTGAVAAPAPVELVAGTDARALGLALFPESPPPPAPPASPLPTGWIAAPDLAAILLEVLVPVLPRSSFAPAGVLSIACSDTLISSRGCTARQSGSNGPKHMSVLFAQSVLLVFRTTD